MEPEAGILNHTGAVCLLELNAKPGSEKGSQPAKAAKRAASDQGRIAQRAYELYEQRGRTKVRTLKIG